MGGPAVMGTRKELKNKKRVVIKIGSSSLFHLETGKLDLMKIDRLVRIISDISNSGVDVILVSSGAIATGRNAMHISFDNASLPIRQACAAIGQAQLITIYQKFFAEYNKTAAQILLTKYSIHSEQTRLNATNTFEELLRMGVIPIVNENDTVTTDEIEFGDNDCLSAMVAVMCGADLLMILSDIDGLYDDNPKTNSDAKLISYVKGLDENICAMAGGSGSSYGTGGMASKIEAAKIANGAGLDMVITNGNDILNILRVLDGEEVGTLFDAEGCEQSFKFNSFSLKD